MNKRVRIISYIAIFATVFLIGFGAGSLQVAPRSASSNVVEENDFEKVFDEIATEEGIDLSVYWMVKDILEKKYVDKESISDQNFLYGSIKGLTMALEDPYTVYMTPEETTEFNSSLNGELEGIGAELTVRNQVLVVVSPLKNSPAKNAGLLPDDIIYKIDGEIAADMTLFDAINNIRGEKGTEVVLTIIREDKPNPFDVTIVRDKVVIESVDHEEVEPGIWLVSINQFSDDTREEFDQAINEISLADAKGVILDLRFNGGGYLSGSVDIMSGLLQGEKKVVDIKYRDESLNESLFTDGKAQLPETPLVVLVNRGSASASEIVAAAIQDYERGIVLGENTFGKGTVQEVDPLPDGSSLRFTIAKWLSPSGRDLDIDGVEPDTVVELTEEDYENDLDPQLNAAIEYLRNL